MQSTLFTGCAVFSSELDEVSRGLARSRLGMPDSRASEGVTLLGDWMYERGRQFTRN